ncbi:MAG: BamA/TamA family outer membrane protein, partial [Bacteroidaceae bacterium]|nr:BamA/TamA family outer membrane protein [Bacteroidaceae bacterium]
MKVKDMARLTALIVLSMASGSARVYAQEIAPDSAATDRDVRKSKNPIAWVMKRLQDSNKQSDKPFNCSVIAGPFYDATSSFAIGGGVSGIYSWDRQDSVLQKSTLSAMVKASVRGMVSLDINGKNYMPRDRYRWNYKLKIANENLYYWGVGYDNGLDDANKGQYRQVKVHFHPDFLFRVARDFYVGPMADVKFTHAYHLRLTDNTPIQPSTLTANGVGAAILYDSRDFSLNAYRGQYLRIEQSIYPKLSNKYHFTSTDVTFCTYHGLWKSAVLAMEYHSLFTYGGEVPWNMLALVGDDNRRMRG